MSEHGGLVTFKPLVSLNKWGFDAKINNGFIYPPFYNNERVKTMRENWHTDEFDVFICTHQKVGTHLAKKYLVEILRHTNDYLEGSGMHSGDIGHHTVPWPEVMISQYGTEAFFNFIKKTSGKPRLWYLHNYFEDLPFKSVHPESKFIHVFRDPRGVALSQYHFYKNHPLLGVSKSINLDLFIDLFLDGKLYFGDYLKHTVNWTHKAPDLFGSASILNIRYEDMVEDKLNTARKLIDFLGSAYKISENELLGIIAKTEYDRMKEEITVNPQSFHLNPQSFFRQGKSYGWVDELSKKQIQKIESKTQQIWGENDPKLPYIHTN